MARKRYTSKGLETITQEARDRFIRLSTAEREAEEARLISAYISEIEDFLGRCEWSPEQISPTEPRS